LVGRVLRDFPVGDRPYVFTKCGLVWNEQDRLEVSKRIGARDSLLREVERSLKRLGVDQIDLYQMHWPAEDGTPIEDYWQTLVDIKQSGKVRAIGLSNHKAELLERAETVGHVDTLQPPFSLIRRDVRAAELPWCVAHETGVIVYSPMQSGLLTGTFTADRAAALTSGDWRSRSPEFQQPRLANNLALADALRPIATRHNTSVGSIAVAWTLTVPGVSAAIVGARSPAQVDGWIDAGNIDLTSADLDEITAALTNTQAGTGPV
jgi:aryl-alcohol dehydrogenase-like predicted oxidoreductase